MPMANCDVQLRTWTSTKWIKKCKRRWIDQCSVRQAERDRYKSENRIRLEIRNGLTNKIELGRTNSKKKRLNMEQRCRIDNHYSISNPSPSVHKR